MNTKKLITWMGFLALVNILAGAVVFNAGPATAEAREAGPQESTELEESSGRKGQYCRSSGRGGSGHGPRGGGMGFMKMFFKLDLRSEQKEAIREGMKSHRKLFKEARERLFAADKALREASLKGEDESTLQRYAEALGKAEADAALLANRQLAEAVQVLDADQRAKLKELHTEDEYEEEFEHHGEEECEHH